MRIIYEELNEKTWSHAWVDDDFTTMVGMAVGKVAIAKIGRYC